MKMRTKSVDQDVFFPLLRCCISLQRDLPDVISNLQASYSVHVPYYRGDLNVSLLNR